jgi:hypothetical protein
MNELNKKLNEDIKFYNRFINKDIEGIGRLTIQNIEELDNILKRIIINYEIRERNKNKWGVKK